MTVLQRLNAAAEVRPSDGFCVFQPTAVTREDVVEFDFKPVVFNGPERAPGLSTNLFVVVEGRLSFRRDLYQSEDLLATHSFSTRAAYFRQKGNGADHIYGAHYDFALDELGHPVFHSQMRSLNDMWVHVMKHYELDGMSDDRIDGILRTVRVPTAQMDVFSFFVQLCADHLLFGQSGPEERDAFSVLLKKSAFMKGAGYQAVRLSNEPARSCYRACHWYPQ